MRSPAELDDDDQLHLSYIYAGILNYKFDKKKLEWKEQGITIDGVLMKEIDGSLATGERKRFFVSLMNESLIKKGVFFRFRKRIRVSFFLNFILMVYTIQPSYILYITHSFLFSFSTIHNISFL